MNNPGNAVIARAAAIARQDKGKRYALRGRNLRPDESSRLVLRSFSGGGRDPMKVAQYEVLGWPSEKAIRPGRDDRRLITLVMPHTKDQESNVTVVPSGTGILFLVSFPSTSYWATFIKSLWDFSSSPTRRPYVDAHQRPRGRDWINGRQPVLRRIFPASIK
jgi:hypothetical protein